MRLPFSIVALLTACAPSEPAAVPDEARGEAPPELGGVMDRSPGRRTLSPGGAWEAIVEEGGALLVRPAGRFGEETAVDTEVDPRVAISPDDRVLVYARRDGLGETDLWRVELPGGTPVQVTAWPGSEDRPVVSPDGRRLVFVSGRTGIASWWSIDLDVLPVPPDAGRQLSNVGVETAPRKPGHPPAGFVPVPEGTVYAWTSDGLSWVADGAEHSMRVTP